MIRGNIEVATPELIQGWIHLESGAVRDRMVLAFCDDECVGSSPVNVFREDLAEVGLGDGYLGFTIPVSIAQDAVGSVVVKLDGSDAVLLQPGARIGNGIANPRKIRRHTVAGRLASLKWALKHGRISQPDFDFHRVLLSLGLYERGLVHRVPGEENLVTEDPKTAIAAMFESYAAQSVEITTTSVREPEAFNRQLASVAADGRSLPLVAVYTKDMATVRALEGSHVAGATVPVDLEGVPQYTEYPLSAESVLLLDTRLEAKLEFIEGVPVEIRMLSATPAI